MQHGWYGEYSSIKLHIEVEFEGTKVLYLRRGGAGKCYLEAQKKHFLCVCVWPCLWYHLLSYKKDAGRWRQRNTVAIVSRFCLNVD